MDDRLTSLLAHLRERFPAGAAPQEVEAYLSAQGFDRRQIGEILSLLFPDTPGLAGPGQPVSIRVLGPHEQGRFASDAWGHLVSLRGAGMLNAAELEYVIERALLHIDGPIALDDLRALMESAGFDESSPGGDHTTVH
jgi:uncharacterized protein Smg (DUF494 family)